jgi:2-keto-4-pentenoate hydratase/2-oxohepta-3-ene-1,7-dioic acid hydratase in catechol pathway
MSRPVRSIAALVACAAAAKAFSKYGSHILTMCAGDVLAIGSPAGVGSVRKPPIFFKAGDVSVCTYEGTGALTNPAVAPRAARTK